MAAPQFKNPVVRWIDYRLPIFTQLNHEYNEYPMPKNCNYLWSFGAIAMVVLITMIVSGITLAMNYTPHAAYAFKSVERIMRDVNFGWLIRYIHANGASMFFIVVFIHIFRGLYFGSYKAPREILWILGVVIMLLMMATAFMGYVLPWGQMSFWGATVITNLFSAVPYVGEGIVTWLWGGFSRRGRADNSAAVYGCRGSSKSVTVVPLSTTRPPYITSTRSVRPATTPRSCVTRIIAMFVSVRSRSITSRIWRCIVTSSAVVGSSASSSRGAQAMAIAMHTRWRMPPDISCG